MPRASKTGISGLQKLPDGRFKIDLRYLDSRTRQRRRHAEILPAGTPYAAARRRAQEVVAGSVTGDLDRGPVETWRLRKALDEYLKWAKVERPLTLKDRTSRARVLCEAFGDKRVLEELSPFSVEKFKRDRREVDRVEPATVNRALALLKHFVGKAAEWGWMTQATADAIRHVSLLKEPPGRVRYLTPDEEKRLFGAMDGVMRRIILAALLTGCRRGEILRLRRDAVDLANRVITLTRTKTNRVRRVPINDSLALVLDESLKASKSDEYVFPSRRGRPYSDNGARVAWDATVDRAKLVDFHFHDLRHDFATKLRRRGVGLDVIATLLGHTCLATTQRYAHVGTELLRAAVDSLPRIPLPASVPQASTAPSAPAAPPDVAAPAGVATPMPQQPPLKLAN